MKRFGLILALMLSFSACSSVSTEREDTFSEQSNVRETAAQETAQSQPVSSVLESDGILTVNYIDVGQGDSILITTPDDVNMLIDAGEGPGKSGAVISYLVQNGVDEIDTVIATHPHSDHISAMDEVLNSTDVSHFYMPDVTHTTDDFENMLDALEDVPDVRPVKSGYDFNVGEYVSCKVLAPSSDSYEDLNNYSVAVKLTYGDTDFIFTGDAEDISEEEMLASGEDLSGDVLKCGHHGSSSSTTPAFVEAVDPEYAVISCGKNNSYGHPDSQTLATLNSYGVTVLRTDEQGTITLESDGEKVIYSGTLPVTTEESTVQTTVTAQTYSPAVEPAVQETAVSFDVQSETSYIGNKNSKKFHKTDCGTLPAEKNRVYFSSRDEAIQQGYSPCKNCDP